jgi:hypothetical protein
MVSQENDGLRKIRQLRTWAWFFFLTYVPVVWLVKHTTHSDTALMGIVFIWVIGFVVAVSRTAFSHCPRCNGYFHSTRGTPSFFNLLARKCIQCGLPLRADRVIYQSLQ